MASCRCKTKRHVHESKAKRHAAAVKAAATRKHDKALRAAHKPVPHKVVRHTTAHAKVLASRASSCKC